MIIAVDPGLTTGVFILRADDTTTSFEGPAWDAVGFVNRHLRLEAHVVAERFTFTPKLTHQYEAVEVIGALRWLTYSRGCKRALTLQSRSDRLRVPTDYLREIGWWTGGVKGDVNEAARHCLVYLARWNPGHKLVQRVLGRINT